MLRLRSGRAPRKGDRHCLRAIARSGLVAFGLTMSVSAAQGEIDCGNAYKDFWGKLAAEKYPKVSPEQLARLNRKALRVYDACETGHLEDAKTLFERLDKSKD